MSRLPYSPLLTALIGGCAAAVAAYGAMSGQQQTTSDSTGSGHAFLAKTKVLIPVESVSQVLRETGSVAWASRAFAASLPGPTLVSLAGSAR